MRKEESGLEKDLETIANTQNQFPLIPKFAKCIAKEGPKLVRKEGSGTGIIPIGEAAGDNQNLEVFGLIGVRAQFANVYSGGLRTGQFTCVTGFEIAVCARCSKD